MKIPSGNLQWYNETSLELCIFPSHWTSCPGIHEGTSLSSTEIVHYCKREIQQLIGPEQTLYDDWSYVVCPGLDSLTWGRTMMFSHPKYTLTDWLTWRQSWSFPWAWRELRKRWDSSCDNVWPDIQTLCWPVRPGEKSARCRLPLIVCYPWNEVFMKLYRNYLS